LPSVPADGRDPGFHGVRGEARKPRGKGAVARGFHAEGERHLIAVHGQAICRQVSGDLKGDLVNPWSSEAEVEVNVATRLLIQSGIKGDAVIARHPPLAGRLRILPG